VYPDCGAFVYVGYWLFVYTDCGGFAYIGYGVAAVVESGNRLGPANAKIMASKDVIK